MVLRDKLEEDIKESMRKRDQARLDALRFLKFAVQAVEKEQKKELDDAGMVAVATKQASDRRDSIRAFEEGGREARPVARVIDRGPAEVHLHHYALPARFRISLRRSPIPRPRR